MERYRTLQLYPAQHVAFSSSDHCIICMYLYFECINTKATIVPQERIIHYPGVYNSVLCLILWQDGALSYAQDHSLKSGGFVSTTYGAPPVDCCVFPSWIAVDVWPVFPAVRCSHSL